LVSTLTTFRCLEHLVEAAAESLLAESHSAWEVLLVDGGSVSESASRLAAAHPERMMYVAAGPDNLTGCRHAALRRLPDIRRRMSGWCGLFPPAKHSRKRPGTETSFQYCENKTAEVLLK
jgi:hypothetical protein